MDSIDWATVLNISDISLLWSEGSPYNSGSISGYATLRKHLYLFNHITHTTVILVCKNHFIYSDVNSDKIFIYLWISVILTHLQSFWHYIFSYCSNQNRPKQAVLFKIIHKTSKLVPRTQEIYVKNDFVIEIIIHTFVENYGQTKLRYRICDESMEKRRCDADQVTNVDHKNHQQIDTAHCSRVLSTPLVGKIRWFQCMSEPSLNGSCFIEKIHIKLTFP